METEKNEFTILWFDTGRYHTYKYNLKKIFNKYSLVWNEGKIRVGLSYEIMLDIYKTFRIEDVIVGNKELQGRWGATGIWENRTNAIKIIMFDKISEDEHLPVLLVYKGEESSFYKELVSYCITIGCEIGKVVEREDGEYEEIFRKKKNVKMLEALSDDFAQRKIMVENFLERIRAKESVGEMSSKEFIEGWKSLINKYGTFTDKMLIDVLTSSKSEDSSNNSSDKSKEENA